MLGGYTKGSLLSRKLHELNSLTKYDAEKIVDYKAQLKCLLDLDIINKVQAQNILDMYLRLEEAEKWQQLQKQSD